MASVNAWYAGYTATTPGIAGSLLTFLYYGAGLWTLFNAAYRRYTLRLPRRAAPFAIAAAAYFVIMLATGLAAESPGDLLKPMLPLCALLFAPLIIAGYRRADPQRAWAMFVRYAPLGAVAGFVASVVSGSPAGGAGNPNVFAVAMTILAIFSLAGVDSGSMRGRLFGAAGFLCATAGVILADARTMYPVVIALPFGFVIAAGLVSRRSLAATAAVIALLLVIFHERILGEYARTLWQFDMLQSGVDNNSVGMRLRLWEAAWQAILDSPILGHGLQNKMPVVVGLMEERLSWLGFTHVHNAYLDAMVAGGVGAGLALLVLLLSPLAMVFGRPGESRGRRFVVVALVVTFLLQCMTGNLLTHDLLAVLAVYPFALAAACDPAGEDIVLLRGRDAGTAPATSDGDHTGKRGSSAIRPVP